MKNIKQSDVLHEGKKVYYTYPNTCEDPEDYILSWLNDYIKDGGVEDPGLMNCGGVKGKINTIQYWYG